MNPKILLIIGCISSSTSATIHLDPSTDHSPIDPARSVNGAWTPAPCNRDLLGSSARPEDAVATSSCSPMKNVIGDSPLAASTDNRVAWKTDKVDDSPGHFDRDVGRSTRNKRALTFPDPSTILLIFGIGTPLQLDRESIIVGAFTKMIYNLPLNSTDFTEPGVYFARTKSRWSVYKLLERAAQVYGIGGGKGCLLRAICEVAAAPFDLHHGLFGELAQAFLTHDWQRSSQCLLRTICELAETPLDRPESTGQHKRDIFEDIIHTLLTPSEDLPVAVNSSHRSVNKLYQEAERLGRSGGDCVLTYPDCIESPLKSFTEIAFP